MRKPVIGVSNQVQLELVCSLIEKSKNIEILYLRKRGFTLSVMRKQRRLSVKSRFSHDAADQ